MTNLTGFRLNYGYCGKDKDSIPTGNIGYGTTALNLAFTFLSSDLQNCTQPYENATENAT